MIIEKSIYVTNSKDISKVEKLSCSYFDDSFFVNIGDNVNQEVQLDFNEASFLLRELKEFINDSIKYD
jgi:6-pyruvoyl-tetrahydropterin synthase